MAFKKIKVATGPNRRLYKPDLYTSPAFLKHKSSPSLIGDSRKKKLVLSYTLDKSDQLHDLVLLTQSEVDPVIQGMG